MDQKIHICPISHIHPTSLIFLEVSPSGVRLPLRGAKESFSGKTVMINLDQKILLGIGRDAVYFSIFGSNDYRRWE